EDTDRGNVASRTGMGVPNLAAPADGQARTRVDAVDPASTVAHRILDGNARKGYLTRVGHRNRVRDLVACLPHLVHVGNLGSREAAHRSLLLRGLRLLGVLRIRHRSNVGSKAHTSELQSRGNGVRRLLVDTDDRPRNRVDALD